MDDGEWISVVDGQPIDVRRLFLGWHQLTVRVMGLQGTETEYHLMVFPSFWACIELILLILVGVSLMVSLHFRKNTKLLLRERKEMEDALIESETLRIQNEEFISKQEALTPKIQGASSVFHGPQTEGLLVNLTLWRCPWHLEPPETDLVPLAKALSTVLYFFLEFLKTERLLRDF